MSDILVTGGAGFIGCNFARLAAKKHDITVLDKLTYAGSMKNLENLKAKFIQGDIASKADADKAAAGCDAIVNFAAETHVDRSIQDAEPFITANVYGVYCLLEAARKHDTEKFVHISTDEVYGSSGSGAFKEGDALNPRNPYSATKAAAEHLVLSYVNTYGINAAITRSSNNYGPHQYPEKFIPKAITNALQNMQIPVYGEGINVRDWLFVEDNCEAIMLVMEKAEKGQVYNIGGGSERKNIDVVRSILRILGKPESLIQFVADRPGHDLRYALDISKIKKLGWSPRHSFDEGMKKTIEWYQNNKWFWETF